MSGPRQQAATLRPVTGGCAHCGLEVPQRAVRAGEQLQFCCSGCRQVHELLLAWGADGYYDLLDRHDGRGVPATISGRSFADFDDDELLQAHSEALPGGHRRIRLYLEGVHCAACVWLVEELPRAVAGLHAVRLNLSNAVAEVEWRPDQVALSSVAQALDRIGYTPHLRRDGEESRARRGEDRALLIKIGVAAVCAMNLMFIHGALYAGEYQGIEPRFALFFRLISLLLALPVVLFAARPFYVAAWAGLRQRVPHMDLPIALALSAAFAYSAVTTLRGVGPVYFDSLAALVALLLGARYLQQRAQRAALERSQALRGVAFVEYARRLQPDGLGLEVPLSALVSGDRVEVRSGELVPVDGIVLDGHSSVDKAVLTGEAEPIATAPGDLVYAGCTNLGARLVIQARAVGAHTRVGALLQLVDEAMARKAPIVKLADRLSRVFVLCVLALAALAGVVAYLSSGGDLNAVLQRTVALLVVTCPCALGLATPVALSVGLSRAARIGLFIKNPDAIELSPRVDTVLLDKTGTLTQGAPTVVRFEGEPQALDLAFALEAESAHPIAQAFRRSYGQRARLALSVDQVEEIRGQGIRGRVGPHDVIVGNRALLDRHGVVVSVTRASQAEAMARSGHSPVFVAIDGLVAGVGAVGDQLRDDARSTLAILQQRGLHTRVLSGDHPLVLARLAEELGLPPEDAVGGLSPEAKRDEVERFIRERDARGWRGRVMMVGDGVNDAAALALSDVGVAVQGSSGASIAAADVVLTRPGLAPLLELFDGSRRVVGIVRRNLAFSLLYNLAGATLALLGLVGPLLAAVLMPISSLTVIGSSIVGRSFVVPRSRGAVHAGRG